VRYYDYHGDKLTVTQLEKIAIATRPTLQKWLNDGIPAEKAVKMHPRNMKAKMDKATDGEAWSGLSESQREELRKMQDLCDRAKWI
jgi:hypothetical protein